MSEKMVKGFGMIGPGEVGIFEKPMPRIEQPRDVIVKMSAVAVCTSDIHQVNSYNPDDPLFTGLIGNFIGHEGTGVVCEVGPEVKDLKIGDRVVLPSFYNDHNSKNCQLGHPEYDFEAARTVDPNLQGMFCEYSRCPNGDANLAVIPDNVTDEQAVIVSDMVATAATGLEYLEIKAGETVAIIGIGPVGLMGVNLASVMGAGRLFAVGSRPATLKVAKELGATDVLDYKACDYVKEILERNGGPVDKVLVCGGRSDKTILEAGRIVRMGGKIANLAFWFEPTIAITGGMPCVEFQSMGLHQGRYFYERLLSLVANGRIQPEKEISHVFHGVDGIVDAFEVMHKSGPDVIKSIALF